MKHAIPFQIFLAAIALLTTGCGTTPLMRASALGDEAGVRALLSRGVVTDASSLAGCRRYPSGHLAAGSETPLICAAINGHSQVVKLLLDKGANPNAKDYVQRDALSYATEYGYTEIVDLLRAKGAVGGAVADVSQAAMARTLGVKTRRANEAAIAARRRPDALGGAPTPFEAPAPAAKVYTASDVDSPKSRGASRPDDFALVMGIEKYSRLPEARFAENDADAMKRHLLALGYPERNIVVLKGEQATRGAIQGYVEEWLPKNTKPSSRVFVYFSGHGSPDTKTGDAYLVPWDGNAMFLKSTAYPLKTLYASLGKLKAKHVLVALDSCFSGAGGRSVLADGARPLVTRTEDVSAPAGVTVLSAASGDEITATIGDQSHGAFTYYLLKAFNNGKLTAQAAYAELKPQVQDEAHRQNREQTPLLIGDDASF